MQSPVFASRNNATQKWRKSTSQPHHYQRHISDMTSSLMPDNSADAVRTLLVATTWRQAPRGRAEVDTVFMDDTCFYTNWRRLVAGASAARQAGCYIRHGGSVSQPGRAGPGWAGVGSVRSVPGQALTRVWAACVCRCACVGYVGSYASYSDLHSVNHRHGAPAVDWCGPARPRKVVAVRQQQQQQGQNAAAAAAARCSSSGSGHELRTASCSVNSPPPLAATVRLWRHYTKYLPPRPAARRPCFMRPLLSQSVDTHCCSSYRATTLLLAPIYLSPTTTTQHEMRRLLSPTACVCVCVCVWTDFDGVFRRIATVERKRSSDNPDNVTD